MSTMDLSAFPSAIASIEQYRTVVETFPRLLEDEERELARRLREENDLHAAWRLVTSHLRYVVYIARGYKGYGLPQEDLIQEGNIGLMKAVQRFDPARGVRLASYASYWIRAHIHEFILKNWRIVKLATTKAKRKLFYKLRGAKKRLDWLNREEANSIAESLDVDPDDVIDMEGRLYLSDQPFDAPADASDDESWAPESYMEDWRYEPSSAVAEAEFLATASASLRVALEGLDDRSRDILQSRWLAEEGEKETLQSLGNRYGISAERVRQLEVAAISRLRDAIVPELE